MSERIRQWVREKSYTYVRHGGKKSRRATTRRILSILLSIAADEGIRSPHQLGRAQIVRFYAKKANYAPTTLRDYHYAIRVLWTWLDRPTLPPKPTIKINIQEKDHVKQKNQD